MKRLAAVVALLVALTAVAYAGCYVWFIFPAKTTVAMHFKDPTAVRFEDIGYSLKKGLAVCGRYDAKNVAGAYVGFRRFVYVDHAREAFLEPTEGAPDSSVAKTIDDHCGG